jgi:hypothetical protein
LRKGTPLAVLLQKFVWNFIRNGIFEKGLPQAKSRLQQPGQSRFVG